MWMSRDVYYQVWVLQRKQWAKEVMNGLDIP